VVVGDCSDCGYSLQSLPLLPVLFCTSTAVTLASVTAVPLLDIVDGQSQSHLSTSATVTFCCPTVPSSFVMVVCDGLAVAWHRRPGVAVAMVDFVHGHDVHVDASTVKLLDDAAFPRRWDVAVIFIQGHGLEVPGVCSVVGSRNIATWFPGDADVVRMSSLSLQSSSRNRGMWICLASHATAAPQNRVWHAPVIH
jgi:hypothetical protein